jgi:hypothetical protein
LKTVVNHKEDIDTVQKKLLALMQQSRVFFDTKVIVHDHGDIFSKTIQKHALTADVVFLGLRAPDLHETSESYATYYTSLMEKTRNYPAIAFVLAGESLDFDKILF